jgi:hypothetical protein
VQLKYKRQQWSGVYYASTDTHTFAVDSPNGSAWSLRIWTKQPSVLVKSDFDFRTMADAKRAAQDFADQIGA